MTGLRAQNKFHASITILFFFGIQLYKNRFRSISETTVPRLTSHLLTPRTTSATWAFPLSLLSLELMSRHLLELFRMFKNFPSHVQFVQGRHTYTRTIM